MKKRPINRLLILAAVISAVLGAAAFLYLQNNTLSVEKFTIDVTDNTVLDQSDNSAEKSSVKIVHLSDLHNKGFGEGQRRLLEEVSSLKPDIILFTGDLVDARRDGRENALSLMRALSEKYPVYRVLGNHDFSDDGYAMEKDLEHTSVRTLRNESDELTINGISISLRGVDDPIMHMKSMRESHYKEDIGNAASGSYNILLAHRPEYFSLYTESGHDLVLSGHAHGGQIRLPLVGGLFSPHQGIFPKYYDGIYSEVKQNDAQNTSPDDSSSEKEEVSMIVSRGLGNSLFPFRVFNYPQIVFIELVK